MKKLFRLATNIMMSNFGDLKVPYRITYIVTYRCQFKCDICSIWKKPACPEMTLEEIKKFFEKSNRFSWVNLSGGEIFLRDDLSHIIKAIVERCRYLYILDFPTNGFQVELIVDTVKDILNFTGIPKLLVTVSLDGPQLLHDRLKNAQDSWRRAVETFDRLRRLRSPRFNVFFGMTLQPDNVNKIADTLSDLRKAIADIRYSDFHFNIAHISEHYYQNVDTNLYMDKEKALKDLNDIAKLHKRHFPDPVMFLERRYLALAKDYLNKGKVLIPCQALSASLFMDPSGNVYPCSIYNRPIGNVAYFDYDISRLWDNSARNRARKDILEGRCPKCWTPCEAYQNILASSLPLSRKGYS